jgi:transmembrane sensor
MKATDRRSNPLKKKLWKDPEVINQLLSDQEWLAHQEDAQLTEEQSGKMYDHILEHTQPEHPELVSTIEQSRQEIQSHQKDTNLLQEQELLEGQNYTESLRPLIFRITRYSTAAVVFVALGFALWTFRWRPQPHADIEVSAVQKDMVSPVQWEVVDNTTSKVKKVRLPDRSTVALYPGGTIKYETAFRKLNRDIYLNGKAYFKVQKNPKRPFSVYAGGLKTTALGTSFTINTTAGHQQTSVKLHTGKIVVSPELVSSRQKAVYLTTAESGLMYNTVLQVASLVHPHTAIRPDVKQPVIEKVLERNGNTLTIKNIPLAEVIKLLSESYQVSIQSDARDIDNITYTGVVNLEKESIESVLQVIALVNNMTVSKAEQDTYKLQKSNK